LLSASAQSKSSILEKIIANADPDSADTNDVEGLIAAIVPDGSYIDFRTGIKIVRNAATGTAKASALVGNGLTFSRAGPKMVTGPAGKMVTVGPNAPAVAYDVDTRRPRGIRLEDEVKSVLRSTQYQADLPAPGRWIANGASVLAAASALGADGGITATTFICNGWPTPHRMTYESAPVEVGVAYVYETRVRRETATAGGAWIIRNTGVPMGVRFMWGADGRPVPEVTHGEPITFGAEKASADGYLRLWMSFIADSAAEDIHICFVDQTGAMAHTEPDEWHHDGSWIYMGRGLRSGPQNTGSIGSTPRDTMQAIPSEVFPRLGPAGAIRLRIGQWNERETGNHTFLQFHRSGGSERILIRNGPLGTKQVIVQVTNGKGSNADLFAGAYLQDGFDLTVSWSPAGVRVYLGGKLVRSSDLVLDMTNVDTVYFGPNASPGATTNAEFVDLRYWPYAISEAELADAKGEPYRIETHNGHRVIVDQEGEIITDPQADVTAMGIQSDKRLIFTSDQYGPPLSFVQLVPGTTSVLKSPRKRLDLLAAIGQSLSTGSSTAPGDMIFTEPLHPPVVLTFPIGPQGAVSAYLNNANLDRLIPAKSVEYHVASNIRDTPILAMATKIAEVKRRTSIYDLNPMVAMSVGVGGAALVDLMEGGSTSAAINWQALLAAFVARSNEHDLTPFCSWMLLNQGEADRDTPLEIYVETGLAAIAEWRAKAMAATGQTTGPKVVIEQIGSRKLSLLPSGLCDVPIAQARIADTAPGVYIRPSYYVIHRYSQDQSHPSSAGYVVAGEFSARVAMWADAWEAGSDTLESDWIGCRLLSWKRTGTTVVLKFNIPGRPLGHHLVYDANNLPAMHKWGIEFLDDGVPMQIVGDPEITAAYEITIELPSAPTGAEKVRLGYTNTVPTITLAGPYIYPGTNIRTSWSQPSAFVPGAMLYDWALIDEIAA